jgi:hypothetical protein
VLDAPVLAHDIYNVSGDERTSTGGLLNLLSELEPGLRVVDVMPTAPQRIPFPPF